MGTLLSNHLVRLMVTIGASSELAKGRFVNMSNILLPERCDRAAAEALLPDLIAAMGDEPTAIDGSSVTQIGQTMLQVLVSVRRSGAGAEITPSPALMDAAQLTRLSAELFDGTV